MSEFRPVSARAFNAIRFVSSRAGNDDITLQRMLGIVDVRRESHDDISTLNGGVTSERLAAVVTFLSSSDEHIANNFLIGLEQLLSTQSHAYSADDHLQLSDIGRDVERRLFGSASVAHAASDKAMSLLESFDPDTVDVGRGVGHLDLSSIGNAFGLGKVVEFAEDQCKRMKDSRHVQNVDGLRALFGTIQVEQAEEAVQGKLFELVYAKSYVDAGHDVQFGSVGGFGGDIVIKGANEYGKSDKTVQAKYLTGISPKKFKENCRVAAEQLGDTRKGLAKADEFVSDSSLREVIVVLSNGDHPVANKSGEVLKAILKDIFKDTPKKDNVDVVTIVKPDGSHESFEMREILR